jgi:hypothetical protein
MRKQSHGTECEPIGFPRAVSALIAGLFLFGPAVRIGAQAPADPPSTPARDLDLRADRAWVWSHENTKFLLVEGRCYVAQGLHRVRSDACLIWLRENAGPMGSKARILARGNVRVEQGGRDTLRPEEYVAEFSTLGRVLLHATQRPTGSAPSHPLFKRAVELGLVSAEMTGAEAPSGDRANDAPVPSAEAVLEPATSSATSLRPIAPTQFAPGSAPESWQRPDASSATSPPGSLSPPAAAAPPASAALVPTTVTAPGHGVRRIRLFPRGSRPFNYDRTRAADGQRIYIFTGGISLIVEELATGQMVHVLADRVVLWTSGELAGEPGTDGLQAGPDQPLEVYLEGNVIVRQGNVRSVLRSQTAVLEGKQAYYNFNTNQALVLDGAVETFDDEHQVPLFMRGDEIRQLSPQKFFARDASFTTSVYRGTPGFEFTAREVYFEEIKQRIKNPFTGAEVVDPQTGLPLDRTRHFVTGYNDLLRVNGTPVFYWPYLRADVEDPLGPLEEFKIGHTDNLGVATTVVLDLWQLLGLDYLPVADRSNWLLDAGYYSERGFGGGTRFNYFGSDLFGIDGQHYGDLLTWWIHDEGEDDLGVLRRGLVPPRSGRGRFRFQHHQELPNDLTLILEASYLSDANFLESFYETEYDVGKDQETLIYLKQQRDSWAWTALFQPRVHDFLPQNPWQPRLDGYLIGLPLLEDRLTYFMHSSIGYGSLRPPNNQLLSFDPTIDAGRFDTRHELNLPLELGPVQFTPFAIGQFTGYTDAVSANGLGRIYGAAGARTSFPFWRTFPGVESRWFNLHGLAHKVSLNADYLIAAANRDFTELPALDQVDDDTSELVRRQNLIRSFGGAVPLRRDPRFFALRNNITTLPEALDDLHTLRLGVVQRLQTKRGPIANQRIVDWMVLDLGATYFPEDDRDNFGEPFGLIDYRYAWHVGDRTTFTSDMLYEPAGDELLLQGVVYFQRPPRTNLALFYSHVETGAFNSDLIGFASSYRFSDKYAGYLSTGYDFETEDNVSYRFGFTRIGLDFVTSVGIVFNAGRSDFGFEFEIVPRAQPRTRYSRLHSLALPFGVDPSENVAPVGQDRLSIFTEQFSTN